MIPCLQGVTNSPLEYVEDDEEGGMHLDVGAAGGEEGEKRKKKKKKTQKKKPKRKAGQDGQGKRKWNAVKKTCREGTQEE